MSKRSREKQKKEAEISENWTGMFMYKKSKRRKLPVRRFRNGILGTVKGKW